MYKQRRAYKQQFTVYITECDKRNMWKNLEGETHALPSLL